MRGEVLGRFHKDVEPAYFALCWNSGRSIFLNLCCLSVILARIDPRRTQTFCCCDSVGGIPSDRRTVMSFESIDEADFGIRAENNEAHVEPESGTAPLPVGIDDIVTLNVQ